MAGLLEVCVDSLASARAAIDGGADRLELCSALTVGGLTPYCALLEQIRRESPIPIRCLIRPRAGDFLYTQEELQMMAKQIKDLKDAGADGFAIGCLTPQGDLDEAAMGQLVEAAQGTAVTLHRAVDVSRSLRETYRAAGKLGIDTVLTSGGCGSCTAGAQEIGALLSLREKEGGPEVLIGAGVNDQVIRKFCRAYPGARAFHMSGKIQRESGMLFRRQGVNMGLPGLDEWHIPETSAAAVRKAKQALEESLHR